MKSLFLAIVVGGVAAFVAWGASTDWQAVTQAKEQVTTAIERQREPSSARVIRQNSTTIGSNSRSTLDQASSAYSKQTGRNLENDYAKLNEAATEIQTKSSELYNRGKTELGSRLGRDIDRDISSAKRKISSKLGGLFD